MIVLCLKKMTKLAFIILACLITFAYYLEAAKVAPKKQIKIPFSSQTRNQAKINLIPKKRQSQKQIIAPVNQLSEKNVSFNHFSQGSMTYILFGGIFISVMGAWVFIKVAFTIAFSKIYKELHDNISDINNLSIVLKKICSKRLVMDDQKLTFADLADRLKACYEAHKKKVLHNYLLFVIKYIICFRMTLFLNF